MDTLDGLKTVVAVVETNSFTAASDRLGISKALVSKYVGEVENQLGIRLFNRTTRQLALTDSGRRYYEEAIILLEQFSAMVDNVTGEQTAPRGLLRISAPVTFGEMRLAPLLPKFIALYPDLTVELVLTNGAIDMLEEGIDVRLRIGGVDDSNMIARHLTNFPLVLSASPNYAQTQGLPTTPEQLGEHHCIIDSNFRIGKQWPFISPKGRAETINVQSGLAVNSPQAVREIAIADGGIAMTPNFIVEDALADGRLLRVMPEYTTLEFGLFAIYPHRKYVARKVRCFIDFVLEQFSKK
ncbi:LysR family transcriptional regulator [Colwellia psychrerythraea]|uniref:Transcriptional regulator, LysR family n=1 Tax=Colwellia psychrerythraea (strain 34H / ATCC BAA-681) TaxID=167879 RepID=Q488D5_COLP3|nr:LysR family transcriptional regulator [Colwellia psychrerythraea]AAZ28529.1 transcriptional regulator, LysR family [Colwellia psychrerythraea 34H]